MRYELNVIEIDRCKNADLTSIMKGDVSLTPNQLHYAENAGWPDADLTAKITNEDGYFGVTIPLSMILGFAEDYRKIIVNAKHELILTRPRTDLNAIMQNVQVNPEEFKILLNKVECKVPDLFAADRQNLKLLKFIEKDPLITLSFRTWEIRKKAGLKCLSSVYKSPKNLAVPH